LESEEEEKEISGDVLYEKIDEKEFHFAKTKDIEAKKHKASDVKSVAKDEFKLLMEKVEEEKEIYDKWLDESNFLVRAFSGGENTFK